MGKKSQKILLFCNEVYDKNKPFIIDGFDDAIIGIDIVNRRLIYSNKKCIKALKKQMPTDEATDYFYTEIFDNKKYNKKVVFCEDNIKKITNI